MQTQDLIVARFENLKGDVMEQFKQHQSEFSDTRKFILIALSRLPTNVPWGQVLEAVGQVVSTGEMFH